MRSTKHLRGSPGPSVVIMACGFRSVCRKSIRRTMRQFGPSCSMQYSSFSLAYSFSFLSLVSLETPPLSSFHRIPQGQPLIVFLIIAFNAFINTAEILNLASLVMPCVLVLWNKRSRKFIPAIRSFRLPDQLGYFVNAAAIAYAIMITIFFCFPPSLPVTGTNMSKSALFPQKVAIAKGYLRLRIGGHRMCGSARSYKLVDSC